MNIAILGAHGSGKSWLAAQLREAHADLTIAEFAQSADLKHFDLKRFDLTLLMGLDLHRPGLGATALAVEQDTALRRHLAQTATAFHSIYGEGPARLRAAQKAIENLAVRVSAAVSASHDAINNEATNAVLTGIFGTLIPKSVKNLHFECDKCGDPDCERRLFSALVSQASLGASLKVSL